MRFRHIEGALTQSVGFFFSDFVSHGRPSDHTIKVSIPKKTTKKKSTRGTDFAEFQIHSIKPFFSLGLNCSHCSPNSKTNRNKEIRFQFSDRG